MEHVADMVRRLLVAGFAAWIGLWAARHVAALAAHWLPPSPPEDDRPPGRMPGPLDALS